jgi:hypothetical protein
MTELLDRKDGEFAVKLARKLVEVWVRGRIVYNPDVIPEAFGKNRGVFTTLYSYPSMRLRGCIGIPQPSMALIDALKESATSVTEDPRFSALKKDELPKIVVEVSVLTGPEFIKVDTAGQYIGEIAIGRDGLIIRHGPSGGLLLPQVPVECDWNTKEFLEQLCLKAGLAPDTWKDSKTKIYRFRSQIFCEVSPGGKIVEKKISVDSE